MIIFREAVVSLKIIHTFALAHYQYELFYLRQPHNRGYLQ